MPTSNEIMLNDLETAQRKRFEKAKDKYEFFADAEEAAVYDEVQNLRRDVKRENAPLRRRRPRGYHARYVPECDE